MIGLFVLFIAHIFLLSQITFTAWPEMLSYPYLVTNSFSLYKDFIYPYPPLLTIILAGVFNTFGFNVVTLKIFTWIFILITDFVLFYILKKLSGINIALIFSAIYILLQTFSDGNMLWFDYATVLPTLLSFLAFIKWTEKRESKYLYNLGIFLGIGLLIKQVEIIYMLAFVLAYLIINKRIIWLDVLRAVEGWMLIIVPFIAYLLITNSYYEFWLWAILYPLTEWSKFPGYVALKISFREAVVLFLLFSPLVAILLDIKKLINNKIFITGLLCLVAAMLAIYPRFSLFHFQPALAFLTIILTIMYTNMNIKMRVIFLALSIPIFLAAVIFIPKEFSSNTRFYSIEDQGITREIALRTQENETIFLLGPSSAQYVFTNTLPPKYWPDNFGWYLEIPGVQEWVLKGFQSTPPRIIFRQIPQLGNWHDLGTYQPKKIVDYINMHYDKTEVINNNIEVWIRKD